MNFCKTCNSGSPMNHDKIDGAWSVRTQLSRLCWIFIRCHITLAKEELSKDQGLTFKSVSEVCLPLVRS